MQTKREPVRRISISLPESIYQRFESLVDQRGFRSRSHAIAELIAANLTNPEDFGDQEVCATLTLCYDHSVDGISRELLALQQSFRAMIVSSFHALVEDQHTVEVLLLRAPASSLPNIVDQHVTLRGVRTGKLAIVST